LEGKIALNLQAKETEVKGREEKGSGSEKTSS